MRTTFDSHAEARTLEQLRLEWERTVTVAQERAAERRRREVTQWEQTIAGMQKQHRALVAAGAWVRGPADFMSVLGRERVEIYHSRMLAWLLDPLATHGLGASFLKMVVSACDPSWQWDDADVAVRIVCEETRGTCRADIVLRAPTFTLIIENKVDAPEGHRQCDRVFESYEDEPNPIFAFLTLTGQVPHTATGLAAEGFQALSYRQIAAFLDSALRGSSGSPTTPPGRSTAVNYLLTLRAIT